MNTKTMIKLFIRLMKWYYTKVLRRKRLPVWLTPSKYIAVDSAMGGHDAYLLDTWGLTRERVRKIIDHDIEYYGLDWIRVNEDTWRYVTTGKVVRWVRIVDVETARSMCKEWK